MKGIIFAIEEFAVYDGPGIRVNVFFKGCPLRCKWCHNPEGFKADRQIVKSPNGCLQCGKCREVCPSPRECIRCGKCVVVCPQHIIRFSGEEWDSGDLAKRILKLKNILCASGGGVTFSGGEVLAQYGFLCEMLDKTSELNRAVETSGYSSARVFGSVLSRVDFMYYDLKVMNSEKHRLYTGVGNEQILENAAMLMRSGVPYTFRVPFIHGVNTDEDNLLQLSKFIEENSENRRYGLFPQVEFLLYNKMAGAKYAMLGQEYTYSFEQAYTEDIERAKYVLNDCRIAFRNG